MKKTLLFIFAVALFNFTYAQEVVITGYVDAPCSQAKGRTLELYISGTINFTNWNLVRQSNGNGFSFNIDISGLGTLTDQFAYITNDETVLDNEFGINQNNAAIIQTGSINDNGDDAFQIEDDQNNVIDRFGEDGVQPTNSDPWYHKKTYYYRNNGVTANQGNFDVNNWTIGTPNSLANEGLCNGGNPLSQEVPFGSFLSAAMTCPSPTNLQQTSVDAHSVSMAWTPGYNETKWIVTYGESGFNPQNDGTQINVNNGNPNTTINNLDDGTTYDFYISAKCDSNDISDFSDVLSITTLCESQNLPFNQDFEDLNPPEIPICGSLEDDGNGWETYDASQNNTNFGFNNQVLRYQASQNAADAWYFTAGIELEAGVDYQIKYKYANNPAFSNTSEKLKVNYGQAAEASAMTESLANYSSLNPGQANIENQNFQVTQDGTYYFGFYAYSNANQGEIYLDDIVIRPTSSCQEPSGIDTNNVSTNSADLSWVENNSATSWEVVYGALGFDPNTEGTSITVQNSPIESLTNLSSGTTYEVYIKAICNASNESYFSDPKSFTTACETQNLPYTEDFETANLPELPNCTTQENLGDGHNWITYDDSQSTNPVLNSHVLCYKFDINNAANTWFFTKGIALEAGVNYKVTYTFANNTSNTNYFEKLKVGVGDSTQASAMTILADHPHISGGTTETNTAVFSVNTDGVYYIGFNAYSNFNASFLFLDDIEVDYGPDCPKPIHLERENLIDTSVNITWETQGNASKWEVVYGAQGFDPNTNGNSEIVENEPELLIENLQPQTDYDVYVRTICNASNQSEFQGPLSFKTHIVQPENNLLCNAIMLDLNDGCSDGSYTNMGAFMEPDEPQGSCLDYPGYRSVWFKFVAPDNGEVYISTSFIETNFVTQITVFENETDCNDLSTLGEEIGCADFGATLEINDLTPGNTYVIKITGIGSDDGNFCIDAQSDMNVEQHLFNQLSYYPNPVDNQLNISAENKIDNMKIYNLQGQLIAEENPNTNSTSIDMGNVKAGLYLIKINIQGHTKVIKIVKK